MRQGLQLPVSVNHRITVKFNEIKELPSNSTGLSVQKRIKKAPRKSAA